MLSCFSQRGKRFLGTHQQVNNIIGKVLRERQDGLLAEHEVYSIVKDLGFSVVEHSFVTPEGDPQQVKSSIKRIILL